MSTTAVAALIVASYALIALLSMGVLRGLLSPDEREDTAWACVLASACWPVLIPVGVVAVLMGAVGLLFRVAMGSKRKEGR